MKVILSTDALLDLRDIARWIASDNPERAKSFSAELRRKCATLGKQPRRFPMMRVTPIGEIRKRSFKSYLIFYAIIDDCVQILRIVHGSRDWASIFADPQ